MSKENAILPPNLYFSFDEHEVGRVYEEQKQVSSPCEKRDNDGNESKALLFLYMFAFYKYMRSPVHSITKTSICCCVLIY